MNVTTTPARHGSIPVESSSPAPSPEPRKSEEELTQCSSRWGGGGAHTHDDERLTFGCQACIDRVEADQRHATYAEMTDDQLYDLWTSNPLGLDDDLIGRLLVERSVLSIEEVTATAVA